MFRLGEGFGLMFSMPDSLDFFFQTGTLNVCLGIVRVMGCLACGIYLDFKTGTALSRGIHICEIQTGTDSVGVGGISVQG